MQTHTTPRAHVCTTNAALQAAIEFIEGFEDDASQEDVKDLLGFLRYAAKRAAAAPKQPAPIAPTQLSERFEALQEQGALIPGDFYTAGRLMSMLEVPPPWGIHHEAALQALLRSKGFERTKVREGLLSKWGYRAPTLPIQGSADRDEPLATLGTPAAQPHACHPQASNCALPPQGTQQLAAQPAQTQSHQSNSSSPPPVNDKSGSLAGQGGAA